MNNKYISLEDAIKTAWMVLEGVGFKEKSNPSLSKTVTEVFETAPYIVVDTPESCE